MVSPNIARARSSVIMRRNPEPPRARRQRWRPAGSRARCRRRSARRENRAGADGRGSFGLRRLFLELLDEAGPKVFPQADALRVVDHTLSGTPHFPVVKMPAEYLRKFVPEQLRR